MTAPLPLPVSVVEETEHPGQASAHTAPTPSGRGGERGAPGRRGSVVAASWRDRLCGPRAISLTAVAVLMPVTVLSSVFNLYPFGGRTLLIGAALLLSIAAVTFAIALIADQTVLRNRRTKPPKLAVVLGVYVAIGLGRGLAIWGFNERFAVMQPGGVTMRLLQSVALCVGWLALMATVLDRYDRERAVIGELTEERARLAALRSDTRAHLDSAQAQLESLVRSGVGMRLKQADIQIGTAWDPLRQVRAGTRERLSGEPLRDLAVQLRSIAEATVQPTSRSLVRNELAPLAVPSSDASRAAAPAPKLRIGDVAQRATLVRPFRPLVTTIMLFISLVGSAMGLLGIVSGLIGSLVGAAMNFVLMVAAARWLTPMMRRMSVGARTATWFAAVLVIASAITWVELTIWHVEIPDQWIRWWGAIAVTEIVCAGLIALASAGTDRLDRGTRELQATVATYRIELDGVEAAVAAIRYRAGVVLHGSVQGNLIAAALRLQLAADSVTGQSSFRDEQAYESALEEAQSALNATRAEVERLCDPAQESDLEESLAAIAHAWRGLVDVQVELRGDDADARIGNLAPVIAEIAREGVANAAKHGRASNVSLVIESTHEHVVITVTDNGSGPSGQATSGGVGLSRISGDAGHFHLSSSPDGGAVLSVTIALSTP